MHHDWDPSDPADPVFIVLPDGGLSLAYQQPTSPSQKSIALTEATMAGSPRAQPRCRLPLLTPASIRSCICAASPPQRAYSADSDSIRDAEAAGAENSSGSLEHIVTLAQAATGSLEPDAERPGRERRRSMSGPVRRRSRSTADHSMHHGRRGEASPPCAETLRHLRPRRGPYHPCAAHLRRAPRRGHAVMLCALDTGCFVPQQRPTCRTPSRTLPLHRGHASPSQRLCIFPPCKHVRATGPLSGNRPWFTCIQLAVGGAHSCMRMSGGDSMRSTILSQSVRQICADLQRQTRECSRLPTCEHAC